MAKYRKKPIVIEAWQWDGRATNQAKAVGQIIKGIKGELYPCKPNIFDATYELVTDGDASI